MSYRCAVSLLKLQMQMSSVRVVSFRTKHCGEYFAAALMRETRESASAAEVELTLAAVFEAGQPI